MGWGADKGGASKTNADGKSQSKGGYQSKGGQSKSGKGKGGEPKGDSKGKGKVPWSCIPICGSDDPLGIWELSQSIPDTWIDFKHGGRRSRNRLHITFLLKMLEADHLDRLERVCSEGSPAELKVADLFLTHVERITDAEVYCIGLGFASPGLRRLKNAWLEECPDERSKRVHDPYPDKDGHVSIAYIYASAWDDANVFVQNNKAKVEGRSYTVKEITYENELGEPMPFGLFGLDGGGSKPGRGSAKATAQLEPMEIDGSVLEGGGQILRNSLAYSAILGYPVRIVNIRAKRKTPGLAAQHLESFKLVRDVSSAKLVGDQKGSCEVTFHPKRLDQGSFSADPQTAGAITLMIQAALFPLLFAGGTSEVELKGGTDVDFSPPLDFLQRVLAPTLERMGVKVDVACEKRGFFPAGGGFVRMFTTGLTDALKPITLGERGIVSKIEAVCYATPADGWLDGEETRRVEEDFEPWLLDELADPGAGRKPKVQVRCEAEPPPDARTNKATCEIVVHTSTGGIFHGSAGPPLDGPKGRGRSSLYEIWGAAAEKALVPLKAQLRSGAAVDEHLLDQLIMPASLASGTSLLLGGKELSLHAQTAIYIAEKMVPGVAFSQSKPTPDVTLVQCVGVGRRPGDEVAVSSSKGCGKGSKEGKASQAPQQHVAKLPSGATSRAAPAVVADLQNDLRQFSQFFAVQADLDSAQDRVILRGYSTEAKAQECRAELAKIFEFYRFSGVCWSP